MNNFKKGKQAEQLLKERFKKIGIEVLDMGRENTIQNERISSWLSSDNSKTAFSVRFHPDLVALGSELTYVEVKNSSTIEKNCFEYYVEMEERDLKILIFFLYENRFYYCKPSEVPFYTYPSENGLMYHKKAGVWIPVQQHWCFPRQMNQEDYFKFKRIMKCSGASFAHLDKQKIKQLKTL